MKIKIPKSWILLAVFVVSIMGVGAWVYTTPPDYITNQTGDWFGNTSNDGKNYTADNFITNNGGSVKTSAVTSSTGTINASGTNFTNTTNMQSEASYIISLCFPGVTCAENGTSHTFYISANTTDVTNVVISNLSSGGKVSYLCGTYNFPTESNISKAHITLDGNNCATVKSSGADAVFNLTNDYAQINNFVFDGNTETDYCLNVSRGYSISIANNLFNSCKTGINVESRFNKAYTDAIQQLEIRHNTFWFSTVGINIYSDNVWGWITETFIRDNYIRLHNNYSKGIVFGQGTRSNSGTRISGNAIETYAGFKNMTVGIEWGAQGYYSDVFDNRLENLDVGINFTGVPANGRVHENLILSMWNGTINGTYAATTQIYKNVCTGCNQTDSGSLSLRPSYGADGWYYYNTTTHTPCWYQNGVWANATGVTTAQC